MRLGAEDPSLIPDVGAARLQNETALKSLQLGNLNVGYLVTTRMGATRIGFSRPAGFDLGLRNSGVHISGPEFEISRPECLFCTVA